VKKIAINYLQKKSKEKIMKLFLFTFLVCLSHCAHSADNAYQDAWKKPFMQTELVSAETYQSFHHGKKQLSKQERALRQGRLRSGGSWEPEELNQTYTVGKAIIRKQRLEEMQRKANIKKEEEKREALRKKEALRALTDDEITITLSRILFHETDFTPAQALINDLEEDGRNIAKPKESLLELACSQPRVNTDIVNFLLPQTTLRGSDWFCEKPGYELSCHLQSSTHATASEEKRLRTNIDLHNATRDLTTFLFEECGLVWMGILCKPIDTKEEGAALPSTKDTQKDSLDRSFGDSLCADIRERYLLYPDLGDCG
jgi:hypothetical protein